MFTDRVKLVLSAGKGGNGVVAWRREKYVPKGGPAGGDGGNGGSIFLQVNNHLFSLEDYRNKKFLKAGNGQDGGKNNRKGKNGKDLILNVPSGTLVTNADTGELLFDLTQFGEKIKICTGGTGGKGNTTFKSATNQAPNFALPGKIGQSLNIELELKLIADVGLVGFPNAGKSTLMKKLTSVNVKIAPYLFTTLRPNLGLMECEDYTRVLLADIPGIIEGAHLNKGLGISFLKHIERTSVLIFVIDMSGIDGRCPINDFTALQNELSAYNQNIFKKSFIIALNKTDTTEGQQNLPLFKQFLSKEQYPFFEISALTGDGLQLLSETIQIMVKKSSS